MSFRIPPVLEMAQYSSSQTSLLSTPNLERLILNEMKYGAHIKPVLSSKPVACTTETSWCAIARTGNAGLPQFVIFLSITHSSSSKDRPAEFPTNVDSGDANRGGIFLVFRYKCA